MASVTFPVSLGGDGSTVSDDANPTTGLANGGHRTRFVPALAQIVSLANFSSTQAYNAGQSASTANQWATLLASLVQGSDYSAKEYATGVTAPLGSAKAWATKTGSLVDGVEYSAKEWAIGTTVPGGSAKTYAQQALNAPGTSATSTTLLTVSLGSKSLTIGQTGKTFVFGQYVAVISTSDPSLSLSFVDGAYAVDDPTSSAPNWMMGQITAFNSGTGAMTINVTHTGGAGTMASWTVVPVSPPELPSQSGHAGKFLTTNGSAASWVPISNDLMLMSMGVL